MATPNIFDHAEPTEEQRSKIALLGTDFSNMYHILLATVPEGSMLDTAVERLRECLLWAEQGVLRNDDGSPRKSAEEPYYAAELASHLPRPPEMRTYYPYTQEAARGFVQRVAPNTPILHLRYGEQRKEIALVGVLSAEEMLLPWADIATKRTLEAGAEASRVNVVFDGRIKYILAWTDPRVIRL